MRQTFEELIAAHLDDLYSAALCFTLNEHRAEELLQEAAIQAFHQLSERREAEFRLGMLEILVATHLRRQRRRGLEPLEAETEWFDDVLREAPPETFQPFPEPGTAAYRLLVDWMNRVWSELAEGDRLVLWLSDIERIRHSRVAEILGIREEEVRKRHYRARTSLSRCAARQLSRRAAGTAEA